MDDRDISIGCAVAYGLWAATAVLLVTGVCVGLAGRSGTGIALCIWGLAGSAAAATATVRQYHVVTNKLLAQYYTLGREHGRAEAPAVTRLR
ncbi:MAG: hypothetical protein ACRDQA_10445 [Nocardioidaceae bacterium]